jgi:MFS family permease
MMIDTAIDSRIVSSANWPKPSAARVAVALCFFLNGMLFASWVSRIPAVQTALGLNHAMLGLALFGVALGALFAMPLAGWGISRFGSRRTTQVIAAAYCVAMPFLALASNAILLTFALFWFGAFHGAFDVAMNAQAVAVEERYGRPIMSSFHALWSVGGLAGAALGALIASLEVSPIVHFTAVSLLIGGFSLAFANPSLLHANDACPRELIHGNRSRKLAWPPRTLVALGAVAFCIMMGEGAMADWGAVFLRHSTGATEAVAAAGYAVFSVAMAVARFSGDWLSSRMGSVALVRIGSGLAAAGLASVLMLSDPVAALAGFAAVGAGFATIVPQVFSAAGRTPGMDPGTALATTTTIGYSGFLIGPPLIGFAAEAIGLRGALAIIVAMSVVAIVLAPNVRSAESE